MGDFGMKKLIASIALVVLTFVTVMVLSACNFDWLKNFNDMPGGDQPAQDSSVTYGNGLIDGGNFSAH